MKKFIALLAAVGLLIQPIRAVAAPAEFSGGVNNEYEYSEYVFLTGEPVKFTGTYKITETENKDKKVLSYRFSLNPEDKSIEGKLDRQMTYNVISSSRDDKGQTITQTELSKMRESITVGQMKFDLRDYQFSKSDIIDNRPVADFYTGNIKARKYFDVNSGQGKAIVEMSGGDVGYNNFWGSTETQIIDYVITVERQAADGEEEEDLSWQGTVRVQASDSMTKSLKYAENEATYSSIEGGHMRITNREMVSMYEYNLPKMDEDKPHATRRENGTVELSQKMLPKIEMLVVPKFRDIAGHWAEESIKKLYSLDVFDDSVSFFAPQVATTRVDFTKAVMKACNIRPSVVAKKTAVTSRNKVQEVPLFKDTPVTDADYQYIKDAVSKNIVSGSVNGLFKPKDPLTKAQAISILIRALGFESRAPSPGYQTSFDDDRLIPDWAKDSIYVAKEIGLVAGDANNRINAEKVLTRAEASVLLVKFLEFLEKDLQKDYRENIMVFN